MKKMKKILLAAACFLLGASLSLAGTFAFLQDETETAYNVMTSGKVKIEQIELERNADKTAFVDFTKGKPADPAVYNAGNTEPIFADGVVDWTGIGSVGANALYADSIGNVVDHVVFVENTGKNAAYIRTVIAIEAPVGLDVNKIHINTNKDGIAWETINNATIKGVNYLVMVATYEEAIAGGAPTAPSLLQLYLDPTTVNEDTALFGDTWDVLVLSQAVQTTGFQTPDGVLPADHALDVAFGDITATNTPWTRENDPQDATPPYVANTADELAGFLANGGSIVIAEDITIGSSMPVTKDTVLDLNGMTIDAAGTISGCPIFLKNGKLVVKNGTLNLDGAQTNVNGTYYTAIGYDANTELVVDNVTFKGATAINGTWNSDGPLKLTISNSTFNVSGSGIVVSANSTEAYAIINNCNVNAGDYAIFASQGSKVTVNGGNYSAATVISSMYAGTEITVNGGYFDGALSITSNGSLVVKGGTFTADPSAYVADGYVVVEGTVYARSATTTYTVLPIADEATFREAMKKLDNIKLMGNIALDADETITIAENTTKVIDLNGFTLGGLSEVSTGNRVMIDVRGTLTVKSSVEGGKVVYQHVGTDMEWNAMIEPFYVGFNGTLNVDGITIENLGGSAMAYCIDLVNAVNVTVNVTNSTLKSTYIPVRVFNNSATGVNNVTIKSSTLSGKYAFWTHIYLDDGRTAEQLDATLKYDIFNGTNTFESTAKPSAPVIAGFAVTYYFTANGDFLSIWDGEIPTTKPASLVVDTTAKLISINDAAAFAYLNTLLNDGNFTANYGSKWQYSVELNCNIDLNNKEWTPILLSNVVAFDGKGHTISNLKITSGNDNAGLFSALSCNDLGYGAIKNLILDGASVKGGNYSGALVGSSNGTLENVTVLNATIEAKKYVGGLAGRACNVKNCVIKNSTVIASNKTVGGLVGYCIADPGTATATGNTVEKVTVTGAYNVGGMFGQAQNANVDGNTVKNVTVTSTTALPVDASSNEVRTAELAARSAFAGTTIGANTVENVTLINK